jgi:DNA-binding response OmpR family regulator
MSCLQKGSELPRILIVDDDARLRRALQLALSSQGHEISGAAGGEEALDFIGRQAPDLVLLDWRMPGMSGQETCRAIRSSSRVPVIVISSDRSLTEQELETAGANAFLPKPFSISDLLAHIHAALSS